MFQHLINRLETEGIRCSDKSRLVRCLAIAAVLVLVLLVQPGAADVVMRISHQTLNSGGTYDLDYGSGLTSRYAMPLWNGGDTEGPENGTNLWQLSHITGGGPTGHPNFMRYTRWSGVDGGPNAGFGCFGASPHPYANVFGNGTNHQCLRILVRTTTAMLNPSGSGGPQMKWMIIGGGGLADGCDRMIFSFFPGNSGHWAVPGGTDTNHTHVEVNQGVCGGSGNQQVARAIYDNGEWTWLQLCWRWGPEGTAYQRIYINNNIIGSPNAQNLVFNVGSPAHEWTFPNTRTHCSWGNIVSDNSVITNDGVLDIAHMELDVDATDAFDETWYPGTSPPPPAVPSPPGNVRIVQ